MNTFKFLINLLSEKEVSDLDAFDTVVKEAEVHSDLIKSVTWRSAKSVVRKAMRFNIPYEGQAKSALEILSKTAEEKLK